ncbi:MAG: alpha-2-macroglobulin family protein [Rhizobiaceae bacterium]
MRNFLLATLCLVFVIFLSVSAISTVGAAESKQQILLSKDSDYYGFDFFTEKNLTLQECKSTCLKNKACKAFTYNTSAKFCFLKRDFRKLNSSPGAIAGKVVDVLAEPDLGVAPNLEFISERDNQIAEKFRKDIVASQKLYTPLGIGSLLMIAQENLNTGNLKFAAEKYLAALAITPTDSKIWLSLAFAASKYEPTGSAQKRYYKNTAVSATLNGYKFSRTRKVRARSLSSLARALKMRRQYRAALKAYERSLKLWELVSVRHAFTKLQLTHGFRITKHKLQSESRDPRICLYFSENLDEKFSDYERFIRINQKAPQAIEVKGKQLCIDGLNHSQKYRVQLRSGLPSLAFESLPADVNLNLYIRDRSATLRFTGNGFVLPQAGRHGIPIVSVNTKKAELQLFRVGERALAQLLQGEKFLSQLGSYELNAVRENFGAPIWRGTLDIKPKLNREVTTSFPVDKVLVKRKPGVYVLSANVHGSTNDGVTQWFVVSDIGLTTFGGDSKLQVFTRSLSSAKTMAAVEITLLARNNEILATATTNANGMAEFDAGLLRGKGGLSAALISAKKGAEDFVFLDIAKPGFDLSDRGVEGRKAPAGIDVYAWSERGIYRVGETVHIAALMRDQKAIALEGLPLTFVFHRPDGEEHQRIVRSETDLGGFSVDLPLSENVQRGTWKVLVYTDPKADAVEEVKFLVEDFTPEKTDFTLVSNQQTITMFEDANVTVEGKYLYGAPAVNLALEGEVIVNTKRQREGHNGYLFGLADEANTSQRFPLGFIQNLDAAGKSTFTVRLEKTVASSRPQVAKMVVRMLEDSGRAIERSTEVDVKPTQVMIGVRPQFDNGQIGENSLAKFKVIAVDPLGAVTDLPAVSWKLVKLQRNYQWYRTGNYWRYEAIDHETKVANGKFSLSAKDSELIEAPVKWGRYRLELETKAVNGPTTSIEFEAGWSVAVKSTDTPDGLEIALDKSNYKIGDVAHLNVSPRFEGELFIAIATDKIVSTKTVSLSGEGAVIDIPVEENWGAGAYVLATLYRAGDAKKSRMPKRAIGVKWLSVDPDNRNLKVTIATAEKTKPNQALEIPISIDNLEPGERAYVSISAVDVGILNLTNYQSPDPLSHYFGQRELAVSMRDIYGRLINGSLGAKGRVRSGGDSVDSGMSTNGSAPTEQLVAFFSGPIRVDENGKASVHFSIPQFNGTVRIMATAWSSKGVGSAEVDVLVRDPIVLVANLPKFMAPGDTSRLLVEINPTDAANGQYKVALESSDNLQLISTQVAETVELIKGKKLNLVVPIIAKSMGRGFARIRLYQEGGLSVEHEISLNIRPSQSPITSKYKVSLLPNGGSLLVNDSLIEGNTLDGAKINISVARPATFDVASLLLQLDQYPYGCAEQTTSRALPLLYASDFSGGIPGLDAASLRVKIQKAIHRVLAYQSDTGGFSLWGTSSDDLWLAAYVTDFLTRALEKGFEVPTKPYERALRGLENTLAYKNNLSENDEAIAYALYVLARNRRVSAGDLRYYADSRLKEFKSPIAQTHLAAGLALYGDKARADSTFSSAFELASEKPLINASYNYGSNLRDASAMLALAYESRSQAALVTSMSKLVKNLRLGKNYTSTQEQAWMLLAARAEKAANDNILLQVNGDTHAGSFSQRLAGGDLVHSPVKLTNRGAEALQAIVTTIAVPKTPLPAGGSGFVIEKSYYRMNGEEVSIAQVNQNERFVVVIKVKQLTDIAAQFIVTDLLPAGFEIDNPRLVESSKLNNFSWLPENSATHTEFRNDKFIASFKRSRGGSDTFTAAYIVRAVSPGTYHHPAAQVEDMYRPHLSARTATGWMQVKQPN